MEVEKNRKIILAMGIIVSFALLIFSISLYYNYLHDSKKETKLTADSVMSMSQEEIIEFIEKREEEQTKFHSFYLLPFIAFIGLIIGTLIYYIMSEKVVQQEKALARNTKIILKFLSPEEKKAVELLLENNGKMQQYELSHLPGQTKIKTHRILLNLEQKGIIKKERFGKINRITLNKELYEVLRD